MRHASRGPLELTMHPTCATHWLRSSSHPCGSWPRDAGVMDIVELRNTSYHDKHSRIWVYV